MKFFGFICDLGPKTLGGWCDEEMASLLSDDYELSIPRPAKRKEKQVEAKLIEEIERLRAENYELKKEKS